MRSPSPAFRVLETPAPMATAPGLAEASSEQGRQLAARAICEAETARMGSLVSLLLTLGPARSVPVLRHVASWANQDFDG